MHHDEPQLSGRKSSRQSARGDKFRNSKYGSLNIITKKDVIDEERDEEYGEIIENVNKMQLKPVLSPLRAKLKSFS